MASLRALFHVHMRQLGISIAAGAVVAVGTASAVQAQNLTEVNYLSSNDKSCSMFPQYISQEMGFFEEEGVSVNMLSSATTVPYVAFLANGDADLVMLDAGDILQAVDAGQPIKVVYEACQYAADNIVVSAESSYQSLAELKGTTIGLASDGDMLKTIVALDTVGIDISEVTTVVVGDSGPVLARALQEGTISAFSGSTTDILGIEATGLGIRDLTPPAVSMHPCNSLVAWGPTLEEKRSTIRSFLRGWAKGHHAGVLDTKAVMSACKKRLPEQWETPGAGEFLVRNHVYNTQLRRTIKYGEMQPDLWTAIQAPYVKLQQIAQQYDPMTFLETSIIDEINTFTTDDVKAGIRRFKEANQDILIP